MKEKEHRRKTVSLIFVLIGLAGIAYPFVVPGGDSDMGFAFLFIGIIVFLTALIMFFMFSSRAKAADNLFTDENLLADWNLEEGNLKIYTQGLYFLNEIIYFKPPYCFLEGLGLHPLDTSRMIILYKAMTGRNMRLRRCPIEVAIPPGLEYSAQNVITYFNQPLPEDYILRLQGKDEWDELEEDLDE